MNLIEAAAALCCISIYSVCASPHLIHLYYQFSKAAELRESVSRDEFIVAEFRKICHEKTDASDVSSAFNGFKELCCSLWNLNEFSLNCESFSGSFERRDLQAGKPSGRLFHLSWNDGKSSCEVFCKEE